MKLCIKPIQRYYEEKWVTVSGSGYVPIPRVDEMVRLQCVDDKHTYRNGVVREVIYDFVDAEETTVYVYVSVES